MQLNTARRSFRLVESLDDQPQLALSTTDGFVEFHILDKLCRTYGLEKAPFNNVKVSDSEYIIAILRSAADFYWNLRQSARTPTMPLIKEVEVECFKLAETTNFSDDFTEVLEPEPPSENLIVNGQITIDVDEDGIYGYKLTNKSSIPLWVALFYFNPGDLSISRCFFLGLYISILIM
jgi:hypothetical protein